MRYRLLCLSLGLLALGSCGGRVNPADGGSGGQTSAGGATGSGGTPEAGDVASGGGGAGAADASTGTTGVGGTSGTGGATSGTGGATSGSGGSGGATTGSGGSGGSTTGSGGAAGRADPDAGDSTTGAGGATTGTGGMSGNAGSAGTGTAGAAGAADGGQIFEDWILFDSDRDGMPRHIYAVRPDGTDLHRVTSQSASEVEPAVSADGTKLAYVTERGGAPQIDVIDLATRRITAVTQRPEGCHKPGLSPNGRLVAYRSQYIIFTARLDDGPNDAGSNVDGPHEGGPNEGGTNDVGPDDSGPKDAHPDAYVPFPGELARSHDYIPDIRGGPVFTDDGRWVLYDTYSAIRTIHPDGTGARLVFPVSSTMQAWPTISRDGTRVALATMCGNPNAVASIWSVPFEGYTSYGCLARRLSPLPTEPDCNHPAWGPGDMVAWDKGTAGAGDIILWVNDVVTNVTTGPSDDRNPAWSRVRIPPL